MEEKKDEKMRASGLLLVEDAMLCALWRFVLIDKMTGAVIGDYTDSSKRELKKRMAARVENEYQDDELVFDEIEVVSAQRYNGGADGLVDFFELQYHRRMRSSKNK